MAKQSVLSQQAWRSLAWLHSHLSSEHSHHGIGLHSLDERHHEVLRFPLRGNDFHQKLTIRHAQRVHTTFAVLPVRSVIPLCCHCSASILLRDKKNGASLK